MQIIAFFLVKNIWDQYIVYFQNNNFNKLIEIYYDLQLASFYSHALSTSNIKIESDYFFLNENTLLICKTFFKLYFNLLIFGPSNPNFLY